MTPVASPALAGLDLPTDRQLERSELVRLVEHVAARTELWSPYLDRAATERTYAALHRDASVDVWAIFWRPENDTGWHDHDTSSGAVHVIEGALEEHALLVARRPQPGRRARNRDVVRIRALPYPPPHLCGAARRLDPRVFAAALAAGPIHGRRGGRAAPRFGLLRRRAAPAGVLRVARRRLS